MFNKIFGFLSKDIGIDLGTANTLVYVKGRGIVINEPSVVAVNSKTGQILAIGNEAKRMVGRTPAHIVASRPLVEGVISDFEVTEQMLRYFITRVHKNSYNPFPRPRVMVGIPLGVTEVEKRAVEEATLSAGAREVYLIEEPMAAAIGSRLSVQEAVGNMIVDIGGGTSEVAVISLGGVVVSKSLRIAGDRLNEDIIQYARDEFKLSIGERTAEDAKIAIGCAFNSTEGVEMTIRGRDLVSGLPKEIIISQGDVCNAIKRSVRALVNAVKTTIEETPPELVADIMEKGIILAGGGSLLKDLDKLISEQTQMPVKITEDPLTAVVRGCGIVLEDIVLLKNILLSTQYEEPPS
ncbi:MAG: rod shape-determining protein [Spirochaetota bacterium]|nr:rod shape-determining protein [Spirochaetota bacterium]